LNHTSGLPRLPANLDSANFDSLNPYKNYTDALMYGYLQSFAPTRVSGTKYDYSNLGMGLAGNIVSKIKKESYEEMVMNEICRPLDMSQTKLTLSATDAENLALPYSKNGTLAHSWEFDALAGAGAIRSNMTDMLKFLKANMDPSVVSDSLLKAGMLDCQAMQMDADKNLKIGLGWHISPVNSDELYWHNGGTGGFSSFTGFIKNRKLGIVVLTNSEAETDPLAVDILKLLYKDGLN
jgi:D-alanyl-D-alanine-carboxypeptidase/D-alanyl-D-alanine-endopeptidase